MENCYNDEYSRKAKDVSLYELRDRLAEFARVRGWDQCHSPRNLLLALVNLNLVGFDCNFSFLNNFFLKIK